ncbi:MAG: hypothetical protein HZB41_10940 [Ignavibacteriae bacterium]|nr:hypothetical protein [Ignavibacteriota bacterium]
MRKKLILLVFILICISNNNMFAKNLSKMYIKFLSEDCNEIQEASIDTSLGLHVEKNKIFTNENVNSKSIGEFISILKKRYNLLSLLIRIWNDNDNISICNIMVDFDFNKQNFLSVCFVVDKENKIEPILPKKYGWHELSRNKSLISKNMERLYKITKFKTFYIICGKPRSK